MLVGNSWVVKCWRGLLYADFGGYVYVFSVFVMCLFLLKVERKFILGLMSLTCNVQRAIQIHDDLSPSAKGPAKLLTTCFDGIKVCHVLLHTFSYSSLPFFFWIFGRTTIWHVLYTRNVIKYTGLLAFQHIPQSTIVSTAWGDDKKITLHQS